MHDCLWHHCGSDPSTWGDNGWSAPCHPDVQHKFNSNAWLSNRRKYTRFSSEQTTWDGVMVRKPSEPVFTSVEGQVASLERENSSEFRLCRKLCDDGQIAAAVDALNLLVQQRCHVPSSLFYRVLKRCIADKDLVLGKRIHALTVESGYEGDDFLATHLISLYASHGRLEEAMRVFAKVPTPSPYTWANIIFACARHGKGAHALRLYRKMRQSAVIADNRIYVAVLKACASAGDLVAGKEVHAHIRASTRMPDIFVQTGLLDMYAKCGSLKDARSVFDSLRDKNTVTWNAMLAGYAQKGMGQEALSLYSSMRQEGCTPNYVTFVCLLQACATVGARALHVGRKFHAEIEERGLYDNVVVSSLMNMYAKCGSLEDARSLFDKYPGRNMVTWNAMLTGYVQQGLGQEALSLYRNMRKDGHFCPDSVTFICLLQACAIVGVGALHEGKKLKAQIEERGLEDDVVLGCSLVNMYAKCGDLQDARRLFDRLQERDVVTWNAMIAGYAQQGIGQEALSLYRAMLQEGISSPNSVTFISLLQACASLGVQALPEAKQLHAQIEELGLQHDVVLGNGLVNMYAKCGGLEDARGLFDKLSDKSVVTWTAIIAGHAQQGKGQEALDLYDRMQQEGLCPPDSVTYVCLLQACSTVGVGALRHGKQLHQQIEEQKLESDVVLGGSLVNMYAKCGSLKDARAVFDRLPDRSVLTCNPMLAAYAHQGMGHEALCLYNSLQRQGHFTPDSVTFACLLQACASVAGLPLGKSLHAQIDEQGIEVDSVVGAALVNMYAKCGSMFDSQQMFDSLPERTVETWNALIGGYARHGDSEVVFDLLERMIMEGTKPDEITFLSVLAVCSHVGLLAEGRKYFRAMRSDYGINATAEHYTCMMDLLGRAGHLEEALQIANNMPFPPEGAIWLTLLGACQKWNNVEIGQQAFDSAVSLDGKVAAPYVLMANIYARAQRWDEAKETQEKRKMSGAWKEPGQSWWTDMEGVVHTFVVGDKAHPESESIHARLEQLVPKLKKAGYVPHLRSSLRDIPDYEKEAELCGHSEKLAIAYALCKTPEGTTIRVVKNLRVCEDCHAATAYISKVENRTIICRDASRFHVFKEGKCVCGDYW